MKILIVIFLQLSVITIVQSNVQKEDSTQQVIPLDEFSDGIHHWYLIDQENHYKRYHPSDYIGIANNFVAYQNEDGGWPKNIDWLAIVDADSLKATLSEHYQQSTFDNRNTWPQIKYLARAYLITHNEAYKKGVLKGINYIFNTQYENGGWRGWDVDAITYNDDVMTGIMNLLLDIKEGKDYFSFLPEELKQKAVTALNKAIDLTLKCLIVVNGEKTAWGQQHDHNTFKSVGARTFELAGITANESVSVLRFLMRLDHPNNSVINAIESGVKWLKKSKINNLRVDTIDVPKGTYPGLTLTIDRKAVYDPQAKPIWARYYEIETNRPFMCTRQGKKVYKLEDVNPERRAGYAWYGYWPEQLLELEYPLWKEKITPHPN